MEIWSQEQTHIEEDDVKRHEKTVICKQERGRDPSSQPSAETCIYTTGTTYKADN